MAKADLCSMTREELCNFVAEYGAPAFRGKQIFSWIHGKNIVSFSEMTNLPKDFIALLNDIAKISQLHCLDTKASKEDGTMKYLFELEDGDAIESVLMRYRYGFAACISTQVGCRMGCTFCASTLEGVKRNLSCGEMLWQIYQMRKFTDTGRIGSVVLMGSGEPLDNYSQVLKFIHLANDPQGLNLGQRHITVSTCGLVEKIYDLAEENLAITLAVSLHAPNDAIRNEIMPISKKYPIDALLKACKIYGDRTKRRVTFEYALIAGINDSRACAKELAEKLRHMLCHVNLIPVNEVSERAYQRASKEKIKEFAEILLERGIEATIRRELGSDINAACGQLRRAHKKDMGL